ncbi:hypothetical protein [Edaphobacter aggregans]|uniref:hypothetical protein n=1 Tax=Edaphobacter aggregans TaxID=570835 RepID=UPI000557FF5E|nr:hypothetical protein [Edaphobacter aggregans]
MKRFVIGVVLCVLVPLIASAAHAQSSDPTLKNEVGLVVGATLTPSIELRGGGDVNLNSSLAFGAEYDRRLIGRQIAVYAGIDFLASPFDVKASYPAADVSPQYAYLFLTPHVRVKFNADGALQPWLLFGGGYANFAPKQPRAGSVDVTGQGSTGTFEFGGGVDTKTLIRLSGIPVLEKLPIGARFEVRDFYSGQPNYGVPTISSRQNNVVLTGGLLLRF